MRVANRRTTRRRWPLALWATAALAAMAVAATFVLEPEAAFRALREPFGPDGSRPAATSTPTPSPSRAAPSPVLPSAAVSSRAADPSNPGRAAVVAAVERLLEGQGLGADPGALVLTGTPEAVLLARGSETARTPASLAKLAVAAAALLALGPHVQLQTSVVTGRTPSEVVLVGGGDSSLVIDAPRAGTFPSRASLAQLAAATAKSLEQSATSSTVGPVRVRVDDSLFAGPAVSPAWEPGYVRSGVVAPVHALMAEGGRLRKGSDLRAADPALAAGGHFARLLASYGVAVEGVVSRTTRTRGADVLASAGSAPIASLVELMLTTSDNDLAESMARLAARAIDEPASFDGVRAALPRVLAVVGLPTEDLQLFDGSGLARSSKMSPRLIARLLALAAGDVRLRPIVTGLPVAAFTGTLVDRFDTGGTAGGAGVVRAKTGTLTGVAGLAGLTSTASGDVVTFVVLADRLPSGSALAARHLLDRIAAMLGRLG